MCSYIIENYKLKMFNLMTTGGLGWFDTMLWVICKYFASHEPIKSIVYYDFVILVRVCVSNFVRLQRLLRWFYQEFDNFQCSGWDVAIKYHFISSSSRRRNLWLYDISYFSKKNVPSCKEECEKYILGKICVSLGAFTRHVLARAI